MVIIGFEVNLNTLRNLVMLKELVKKLKYVMKAMLN